MEAIKKYQPKVVIGSWITAPYDLDGKELNMYGPDEEAIINAVDTYILIGNENVHSRKIIRKYPHRVYKADWLVSKANAPEDNMIYIWSKNYKDIDLDYFKISYKECCL